MQSKTSILIVSYNTRELTVDCIRSVLQESRHENIEIIIVDNASTDGSADAIARHFPQVHLIRSRDNIGFACGNNLAAQHATGDTLLLLNPDTVIIDRGIERLIAFAAEHPQAGIWGGRTVFADGSLNPKSCWRVMSLWSLLGQATALSAVLPRSDWFNPEGYGGWCRDSVREVGVISGCFLLIRRDLWDRLGGFDERFFMYSEEVDLCYRARQLGARPLFTPHATIIHYGGASEAAQASKMQKLFTGKLTFVNKHWSAPKRAMALPLLLMYSLTRAIGYTALAGLTGAERHQRSAREWREVWRDRAKWTSGYDKGSGSEAGLG